MKIKKIEITSNPGMIKIFPCEEASFFVRKEYLTSLDFEKLSAGFETENESQENELIEAGLASFAEIKAVSYLSRCEQNHFNLSRKLQEKGFEKNNIEKALCFLESKNLLSDLRFANAWLQSRKTGHYEGRQKLLSELLSRGIKKDTANEALELFFLENDEMEICKKAYEKLVKKGKSGEKLILAMQHSGFSYKMIKHAVEI